MAQVVRGWCGDVEGSRFETQLGQQILHVKKEEKKTLQDNQVYNHEWEPNNKFFQNILSALVPGQVVCFLLNQEIIVFILKVACFMIIENLVLPFFLVCFFAWLKFGFAIVLSSFCFIGISF